MEQQNSIVLYGDEFCGSRKILINYRRGIIGAKLFWFASSVPTTKYWMTNEIFSHFVENEAVLSTASSFALLLFGTRTGEQKECLNYGVGNESSAILCCTSTNRVIDLRREITTQCSVDSLPSVESLGSFKFAEPYGRKLLLVFPVLKRIKQVSENIKSLLEACDGEWGKIQTY